MPTLPREATTPVSPTPVIVTIALELIDSRLMASQVLGSGVQVRDAACCAVSVGGRLFEEVHRASISPILKRSPDAAARTGAAPLPNVTSTRHELAVVGSRKRKVGAAKSGGNKES